MDLVLLLRAHGSQEPGAFQVHGIDAEGKVVIRRQLKRRYVLPFF
jgi:hypothetical protein